MTHSKPFTFLCLASYFKGATLLEELKRQECGVILLTTTDLADEPWPWQSIDERFLMPSLRAGPDIIHAVSYLARERQIDRILPLDDYDVETAAALREHLRMPGMGETGARFFRDKLAMRVQAQERGIPVPEFVHLLNYDRLRAFMARVAPPWVLKPRSEAGSMGIKKLGSAEELWRTLDLLGDRHSFYVLEQFLPGDVYHVDAVVWEGRVLWALAHKYGMPPLTVYQGGGVFMTRTLPYAGEEEQALQVLNRQTVAAMGMVRGVTHAEYIRAQADGRFYFLEIGGRVGGAHIDRLIETATGLNLWSEWARLELADLRGEAYRLPPTRQRYAGLLVCLARQEQPDTGAYADPEVVWRLHKAHHAGLIVATQNPQRVEELLAAYAPRFSADFLAVAPPLDRPPI